MADSNEKKVIVLSPAGSKVKASDITRVTDMPGDISDPMKSRDTETASLKKVDAMAEPGKAKMTIKLKPLKPKEAPQEESPKEAPISADAFKTSPNSSSPADLQGKKQEDETVKIEKGPRQPAPSESASTSIPGAKQTIKLRPSSTTPPSGESEASKPSSPSTMKLKPINVVQDQSTPPESEPNDPGFSDEQTVAMQKRTIKLTPTKPSGESQPAAAPTVRLTSSGASVQPPQPSIPTLKFASTGAQAPVQAAPPPPPQNEEAPPQPEPAVQQQQQASAPKRTLKLRATQSAPPPAQQQQAAGTDDMAKTGQQLAVPQMGDQESSSGKKEKGTDEPSIIFTIAASVAFLTLAYFSWMTIGQFGEEYLGWQTANVPGLSGKVK